MAMREHLPQVDTKRLTRLLEIKEEFTTGKISLEEGREKMRNELGKVHPYEIAIAEQELKTLDDDECRKEDIQSMMDLFGEVMDLSRPDLPADHPIICYYRENDEMRKHLKAIEDLVKYPVIPNQWYELYDLLGQFRTHLSRKQNQLYPVLEKKGFDRPTTTMWLLDDFIRDEIRDTRKLLEEGKEEEFIAIQNTIIADVLDLMQKEETVLYPTSLAMITADEFDDMKSGDDEIGFAWIEVLRENKSNQEGSSKTTPLGTSSDFASELSELLNRHGYGGGKDEVLDVATGKLTLEQINLIYQHLPVDISYVDENELVCFYSDTDHRVFPRSKNVIGRDVKNCHPRTSVHIVEEIVEKFRTGEENTVEFWINKPDFFIYIYYVAVRDKEAKFRGVLEMMQDCTHIRSLEGSQTLLSWSKKEPEVIPEEETKEEVKEEKTSCACSNEPIELNESTRLQDLLCRYPFLKDELPKINGKFKMLHTPLARILIPKATIKVMSERSSMKIEDLIKAIQAVIEKYQ